jgi:hypothetical protein
MAENSIEHRGLDEITKLMRQFPKKFRQMQKLGMHQSLMVLWENVPPYPAQPAGSRYDRKGSAGLGGSLGSSERGGKQGGKPDIFTIRKLGSSAAEGRFGSTKKYAPYVIGDQQAGQNRHWWKLKDIIPRSEKKIVKVWEVIMKKMVNFLNSRSSGAQ